MTQALEIDRNTVTLTIGIDLFSLVPGAGRGAGSGHRASPHSADPAAHSEADPTAHAAADPEANANPDASAAAGSASLAAGPAAVRRYATRSRAGADEAALLGGSEPHSSADIE